MTVFAQRCATVCPVLDILNIYYHFQQWIAAAVISSQTNITCSVFAHTFFEVTSDYSQKSINPPFPIGLQGLQDP